MGEIDRQRVAAVRTLEALGYTYRVGEWQAPFGLALSGEADAMYALLVEQADVLLGCPEDTAEDDELQRITAVLQAYEAKRWPGGKERGGKG